MDSRLPRAPEVWTPRSLRILFAVGALVVVALVTGLALATWYAFQEPSSNTAVPGATESGSEADQLAAKPLPSVDPDAAKPGPLSTVDNGELVVPAPTGIGPAEVASGYPRTPEGALAQMAAIVRAAVESGSVPGTQEVIASWAVPGGPTTESWSGVRAVRSFLESAGLPATGSATVTLQMEPTMGFIKGTASPDQDRGEDGGEVVVPCVDYVLVATTPTATERTATAGCQRMVWHDGRWMIGAGAEPTAAPSVWPGTEKAAEVGYLMLTGVAP